MLTSVNSLRGAIALASSDRWRGVPFYFVRVDQAGNITKRHSSTRFQFARFGGACPLWNVHEAFGHPGRILVQVAEMPDGVRYLCVGRSIVKRSGNFLRPNRQYAIGIGCEVAHADKVVYSEGLQLDGQAVPVGVSCRICERPDCHQRAFPPLGRKLTVRTNERRIVPFALFTGIVQVKLDATGKAVSKVNGSERELSGGEQQRVVLARALVGNPSVLLADEPTGSLDHKTGEAMMDLLDELHRSRKLTSIHVTHNLNFARRSSRVLALQGGCLMEAHV